ncbi:hypothetical protein ACIOJE_32310 [Kitasatospora sp. NPDC087861]|uniref:hypothetical protein n=1 Tax=unclassified Kitasatospora TaxID=2633591 RepID=UPI002476C5AE|nr:hypothetical protein [Kitasatospora sp. MAA19]
MTQALPIESAEAAARRLLDARTGSGGPSPEELFDVLKRFERIEFAVPDLPDADGFIFQYGCASWFAEPAFTIGFSRQFEVMDQDGEHECYSQLAMEYRYEMDADLQSLAEESWWFRDSAESFDAWLQVAIDDPVWRILRGRRPREFDISQSMV